MPSDSISAQSHKPTGQRPIGAGPVPAEKGKNLMPRHTRRPKPVTGFRPTAGVTRGAELIAARADGKHYPWYRIANSNGTADISIFDEIGWDVTASDFAAELHALGDVTHIRLHVCSPGGSVFDGISIYNALRRHQAKVTTYVDSIAASAASVIAMAGDRVVVEPQASLMIHEASALCIGNAADMRETADLLDRMSGVIAGVYAASAGGTVAKWRTAMKAETWYSAEEAVAAGLADEVLAESTPRQNRTGFAAKLAWEREVAALLTKTTPADDLLEMLYKKGK